MTPNQLPSGASAPNSSSAPPTHWHTVRLPFPPQQPDQPPHFVYPTPMLTPVAHVPIGAAHYAHLPPSIWTPAHSYRPSIHYPVQHTVSYTYAPLPPQDVYQRDNNTRRYPPPAPPYDRVQDPMHPTQQVDQSSIPHQPQIQYQSQISSPHAQQTHASAVAHQSQPQPEHPPDPQPDLTKQEDHKAPSTPLRKPRKPYTITKSREVWTQEEHSRFLHALQLYDRDWKKIESYIGTKTVLQIRSHAQKHFGKVAKYNTGEYIPPPRPKKRASMPYPRSRASAQSKSVLSTGSDSGAGSENGNLSGSGSGSVTNGASSETVPGGNVARRSERSNVLANVCASIHSASTPSSKDSPHITQLEAPPDSASAAHATHNTYYNSVSKATLIQQIPRTQSAAHPNTHNVHVPAVQGGEWSEAKPVSQSAAAAQPDVENDSRCISYQHAHKTIPNASSSTVPPDVCTPTTVKPPSETMRSSERREMHEAGYLAQRNNSTDRNDQTVEAPRRKDNRRTPGPNDSLLVLSNCVDMMSRDAPPPERQPAVGWASAAAARRAHRARIIRGRKPPLPNNVTSNSNIVTTEKEAQAEGDVGEDTIETTAVEAEGNTGSAHRVEVLQVASSESVEAAQERGKSPQTAPADEANRCVPQDPQRSSAGSGTGSDEGIAGFSSSDRPSVSDMGAGGSRSGGSLDNSDSGEQECDPNSSNDSSGDDGANRTGSSTRDSSPGDPTSSGSREVSPNTNCTENEVNVAGQAQSTHQGTTRSGNESRGCSPDERSPARVGALLNPTEESTGMSKGEGRMDVKSVGKETSDIDRHSLSAICSATNSEKETEGMVAGLDGMDARIRRYGMLPPMMQSGGNERKRARSPSLSGSGKALEGGSLEGSGEQRVCQKSRKEDGKESKLPGVQHVMQISPCKDLDKL